MIFKFVKTELRNLFYSPVAWFLTVVFMIQCAVFYTSLLLPAAKMQDLYMNNNPKFKDLGYSLTSNTFLHPSGIFTNALQNLYLFVPLLTMGLISREINSGTIKLLYSSPVKVRHIVFGKYIAIMLYNLLLVGIVGIFMITGAFNIVHIDYGMLLSALLGFYLLICAYTAIGLFMSSLTNYQIVSAIASFLIVFILGRIGGLWQKYDFVRDLTYFLSMSGRTINMLKGLIVTKDVVYFVAIVGIFIGFTLIKLRSGRESKPAIVNAMRYIGVFAIALVIGYLLSRPSTTLYFDLTASQRNTIHPNTQKVIKELGKEPMQITMYTNLMGPGLLNGLPERRNAYLSALWEPYLRFKPDISFKYVYYYDVRDGDSIIYKQFPHKTLDKIADALEETADAQSVHFETPKQIRSKINLDPENYRLVMKLDYKGRSTWLRTYDDPMFWPMETQVSAALKRLLQVKLPKVYFLNANLERNPFKRGEREYARLTSDKLFRVSLINAGFDVDTLSLDEQDVPADASVLVLADPKTELSALTMSRLQRYIAAGGNMMFVGEPGKQQMVNPVLHQLGVQLTQGTIVQPTSFEMPQMIVPYLTRESGSLADDDVLIRLRNPEFEDTLNTYMDGATALRIDSGSSFTATPLLRTYEKKTWLKMGHLVTDSAQVIFNEADGDQRGSFVTGLKLTRQLHNREQRIIIFSDGDYPSNLRALSSESMVIASYSWLVYNEFPVYAPGSKPKDNKLKITTKGVNLLTIVYVWILPALVLLLGTVILIRRKRK